MDVLDVAWGDDDKVLASCSIDNTVLIWDVETKSMTMTPKTTLRGHKNWVKGVAWDPTGRFLASAGEDRRVLVWRRDKNASSEFRVEADIRAPFEDVTAQTFFQRLSWAPDGRSLGVPNARKALQATACVLARGKWESVADLVGHRHPVTVVRFSPVLFHGEDVYIDGQKVDLGVRGNWTAKAATHGSGVSLCPRCLATSTRVSEVQSSLPRSEPTGLGNVVCYPRTRTRRRIAMTSNK